MEEASYHTEVHKYKVVMQPGLTTITRTVAFISDLFKTPTVRYLPPV